MNVSMLSVFQTEPWSLVFLGASLFVISSLVRRRTIRAVAGTEAHGVTAGGDSHSGRELDARDFTHVAPARRLGLRLRLRTRLQRAA